MRPESSIPQRRRKKAVIAPQIVSGKAKTIRLISGGSSKLAVAGKSRAPAASRGLNSSRQRLMVTGIGGSSVFRVSLVFYTLVMLVVSVASMVLWNLAAAAGLERKANRLIDQLIGSNSYHIIGWQVFIVFVGIGILWVAVSSVVTFIGVRLFNVVAEMVGGISLYVRVRGPNQK